MALIIHPEGTHTETQPKNGKYFELKELQGIVGGYIEIVRVKAGYMIVNEEGHLLGMPRNNRATNLYWEGRIQIMPRHFIVGTVLVCKRTEVK